MGKETFIDLKDLEVYRLARELSGLAWKVYKPLDWNERKIIGNQFIESIDSVGANIAEGYRRYHRLDKIKFYYNSRGSLSEAIGHWLELLADREMIDGRDLKDMRTVADKLSYKLESFIRSTYRTAVKHCPEKV